MDDGSMRVMGAPDNNMCRIPEQTYTIAVHITVQDVIRRRHRRINCGARNERTTTSVSNEVAKEPIAAHHVELSREQGQSVAGSWKVLARRSEEELIQACCGKVAAVAGKAAEEKSIQTGCVEVAMMRAQVDTISVAQRKTARLRRHTENKV